MKNYLISVGFVIYKTGCPCNGTPRYFKNSNHPDYIIVLRGNNFSIRKGGAEKTKGNTLEQLTTKIMEYELNTTN